MSVELPGHFFHLKTWEGVTFMVLTDSSYPAKLAFTYLEEVIGVFQEEMQKRYGTGGVDYGSRIETIDVPYAFQNVERFVSKKRKEYKDSRNIERINKEIADVGEIMKENIDLILNRKAGVENLVGKASTLKTDSKRFKENSEKLKWSFFWRKYQVYIVVALVFILFILYKLFL